MSILKVDFMEELVDACHYFWKAGWGEFHAGNISYLLSEDECQKLDAYMKVLDTVEVSFDTQGLEGKHFVITRAGACFRTMKKKYESDLGIIRFNKGSYDILWGLSDGKGRPTSELPTHVLCHRSRLLDDKHNKIVMHCHPTYVNAMTMIHDLDENKFTETLWKMNSECCLVFPEGIAVLPWMVCGEGAIGPATAEKMETKKAVVWPFHGIFSSGSSIDDAIGLIETMDKNAQVYVLVKSNLKHSMTNKDIKDLKIHFNL